MQFRREAPIKSLHEYKQAIGVDKDNKCQNEDMPACKSRRKSDPCKGGVFYNLFL